MDIDDVRIVAFDVETPNSANDSICSIGITVTEGGEVTDERYYLVNPMARFDYENVSIHGITPDMVEDAVTFPDLWREIEPIMRSGILAAHNARFDMGVLAGCLRRARLKADPALYVCSLVMARQCVKGLPRYSLDSLCRYYGIALDHHNACSDARACSRLVNIFARMQGLKSFVRSYDFRGNGGRGRTL